MANQDILNTEDVFRLLDSKLDDQAIQWNSFYAARWAQAPFIVHSDLPDENLIEYFISGAIVPKTVLELGCGEGRNAVYMAKLGCEVTAVDLSESAIANVKVYPESNISNVNFL